MVAATIPGLFLTGDHASRPAANAVGSGALYSCSTHSLIYQSDGSSWSTWATLTGTGLSDPMTTRGDIIVRNTSNATARLAVGSAGTFLGSDGTDVSWTTPSAAAPSCYESFLSSDRTIISASTWYSSSSLSITPASGTYLAIANLTLLSGFNGVTNLTAGVATGGSLDGNGAWSGGTVVRSAAQGFTSDGGADANCVATARVTVNGSTAVWALGASVRGSSVAKILTTDGLSMLANTASSLQLIKITSAP